MPIEMPKGLPFSVDTWSASSKSNKRHHFLTHAHKDHSVSITSHSSFPIYSTLLTKTLLLQQYPQLDASLFLDIEIGQSLIIDDPDGTFTVTAFDANHCPGAVMFLFEGKFGNILHTGDCRLTLDCILNLPDKYVGRKGKVLRCPLDCIFRLYIWQFLSIHACQAFCYSTGPLSFFYLFASTKHSLKPFESDSMVALSFIKDGVSHTHPYTPLVDYIRSFTNLDWRLAFSHSLREGNNCADWLAKYGSNMDYDLFRWPHCPRALSSFLLADAMGITSIRE